MSELKIFRITESVVWGDKDADYWPTETHIIVANNIDEAARCWLGKVNVNGSIDDQRVESTKSKIREVIGNLESGMIVKL